MCRSRTAVVLLPLVLLGACSSAQRPAPPGPPSRAPAPTPAPSTRPQAAAPNVLPSALRGTEWDRLPTDRRVVALTFDAGANADAVTPILSALAAAHAPATFFLTGQWVQRYPEQARRIAAAGYPIGNHTQSHPSLPGLSDAGMAAQIAGAAAAITTVTGRDPRPLFRFPYGARNAHAIALVNAAGHGSIWWTVDTTGWLGTSGGMSTTAVLDRALAALEPGEIVLMHVGSHPTDHSTLDADALPELIRQVRARGYEFVSVTEFL
ncbi:polysaccharide deacetylase family protein [Pseudonocardia acidicola]|uniref:Polysaccharide deacetylase family protein n=1 Tax=Pseudonocardia acidicola TaxID=2724939 RepID=A0ABX1SAM9_9PSEU|nr:polysaccharide deacetylase family protein [Pseudonocardia acidicola]NMH97533.1 polysaccharide deacetylase family protein [Pseudonocardia acidicola]